jgi:hypothetical protein
VKKARRRSAILLLKDYGNANLKRWRNLPRSTRYNYFLKGIAFLKIFLYTRLQEVRLKTKGIKKRWENNPVWTIIIKLVLLFNLMAEN